MFARLRYDINAIKKRDPAARNKFEIFMLYSGLHAVMWYRVSHFFYRHRHFYTARFLSQWCRRRTGIEIHPGAQIGKGLFIDHGMGVVIGETTIIGDDCTIYQGVTLGGTGKDCGKRHPTLEDNVLVGAGAKILGPFTVGSNARIAAGAVVLHEVPANSTAVGVPARVVIKDGVRVCGEMDQIHVMDPVEQELCRMHIEIDKLKKKIYEGENKNENL